MKKLIYLLIILSSLFSCKKENDTENQKQDKLFYAENLSMLNLADIDGFWDNESILDTSYYMGATFENHPGFIDGIRVYEKGSKSISVSVFVSQDTVKNAMKLRIDNVAAEIQEGTTNVIQCQWWFTDNYWNPSVFVNELNTIIEVSFVDTNSTDIDDVLYSTAIEIINSRSLKTA